MALKAAKFFKRPDALKIVVISHVAVAFPHHNQDFSLQRSGLYINGIVVSHGMNGGGLLLAGADPALEHAVQRCAPIVIDPSA
jgi:hypothetical protein